MGSEIAVSVRNVTMGYDGTEILKDISFDIPTGRIVTILGGSGCGKSTLLKTIIGLNRPMKGDILIDGRSIVNADEAERRAIMRTFGVAYQGGALFRSLTLEENIALPLEEYTDWDAKTIAMKVSEKLAMVNLEGYGDYMPSDLSGGMVKRAAFARALALDPRILFFDEPSAGLDPLSSANLDQIILGIRERTGATIIVVSHELHSIFTIADTAIMLDRGTQGILAQGPPSDLRSNCPDRGVRLFLSRGLDGTAWPDLNRLEPECAHGGVHA